MNLRFYVCELRRQALSFSLWFLLLGSMTALILYHFPTISSVIMEALLGMNLSAFTQEMKSSLNIGLLPDLSEFKEYFAFFIQIITLPVCFYASSLGVTALSEDIGEGTMDFLCAQPISRLGVLVTKLLSRVTTLLAFDFALFLLSAIVASISAPKDTAYLGAVFAVFATAFLSHLIFLLIGFCVSSFWSSAASASSFSFAIVFFTTLVGLIAPISSVTSWLRVVSPFHYAVPSEVVVPGYVYPAIGWALLLLGGAFCVGLSYLRFYKRDLAG